VLSGVDVMKFFEVKLKQSWMEARIVQDLIFIVDAGPRPEALMPKIDLPLLLLWGEKDPWTPANGPV
jgi:pimeloyl-ACP methyl ester carboxylesterase